MYKFFFKFIFDFIFASIFLIILTIPFIVIALFIKFDSKGPVFFKQERIGKNLKNFRIFKFRTMVSNAEKIGGFSTKLNDDRITKVGEFLRKTSIDELPQLINILLGHMSFIGPRPDVPAQKINYTEKEILQRHKVLPGITGLAQSRNRHYLTIKNRKTYDLFYSRYISIILDIKIIYWTIKILKRGSY